MDPTRSTTTLSQTSPDSTIPRLCFLGCLIESANPEVQDEFYAIADTQLPSSRSIASLIKEKQLINDCVSEGMRYWRNPKQVDKTICETFKLVEDTMQRGWQALPESVRNMYGEISPTIQLNNPNAFSTIFTALHAHNLWRVGQALEIVKINAPTTKDEFLKTANSIATGLIKDHPPITPSSLKDKGIPSIPREISYAGMQKRELMIEHVKEASYASLGETAKALGMKAFEKGLRVCADCIDLIFLDSSVTFRYLANCLKEFPSMKKFDAAHVCRDVMFQKLQGIMLTKKEDVCTRVGKPVGSYLMVVRLATNPQNIRLPGDILPANENAFSHVEGCGTALISFAAQECLRQQLAGIYLGTTYTARPFFEKLGFENIGSQRIETETTEGYPMELTAQKIEKLFQEGKLRVPVESTL